MIKKPFLIILKIIIFFFSFPIIFLFKKKFKKLILIDMTRIGHMCPAMDLFFHFYKTLIKKKSVMVFFLLPICNSFLFNIFKNKLNNYGIHYKNYNSFLFAINRSYKMVFKEDLICKISDEIPLSYWKIFFEKKSNFKIKKNKSIELKFGIKNSKWICIHNRDSRYLQQYSQNFSYHNHRDFLCKDLLKAANWFTKKGFYVIRMGNKSNQKLISKNSKIIDYVNSDQRSDFFDIYFLSRCCFYFGGTSGIATVPLIFRKPKFFINVIPLQSHFSYMRKNPAIFKKLKKKNKILSLNKILRDGFYNENHSGKYIKKKLKIIDNSDIEILAFAKEAYLRYIRKWKSDTKYLKKKKIFENILSKHKETKNEYFKNPIGRNFLLKMKL